MKSKQIVLQSMETLSEDTTYVKIAVATQFVHALIFNILILYYMIAFSPFLSENTVMGGLINDYIQMFHFDTSMLGRMIVISIFLFIGYELLPPIGEAAMIYHLDDTTTPKSGSRSFAKGLYKFFPMFEFGVATTFFKASAIMLVLLRLFLFDLLSNTIVVILMSMRIIVAFFVALLLPYTKMYICLQGLAFFDAMKASVQLSVQNIIVTLKFVIINAILAMRFLVNIAIIVGIPIGLIYLASWLGLDDIAILKYAFLIILIGLVFFVAYIEGLIEGFFTAARWKIYKEIKQQEIEGQNQ